MPYRIDLQNPPADALDRLLALDALDVEEVGTGLAALLPDAVDPERVAGVFGVANVHVSPAVASDDGSVWILNSGPVRVRRLLLVPAHLPAPDGALRLIEGPTFGSGRHPTTALCLEILDEELEPDVVRAYQRVGMRHVRSATRAGWTALVFNASW